MSRRARVVITLLVALLATLAVSWSMAGAASATDGTIISEN